MVRGVYPETGGDMDQDLQPIRTVTGIESKRLGGLFGYWHSKRRGRRMPDRADIDPLDIPKILPNIVLVESMPERLDCFRYRLIGAEIVRAFGRDLTGQTTDEILTPALRTLAIASFVACRDAGAPLRQIWIRPLAGVRNYERIVLPLADGSVAAAMILVGIDILADATAPRPFAAA
ncbi:MAG: PAS domain-containing protein [Alphaproteobacteria bacterium]|nr:PAS domain-containing protein [Alphaproteobacteria bacterium]